MKWLLAALVIVLVVAPLFLLVLVPYWECRAHQKFERWMRKVGISKEMLTLAEKAISEGDD